MKDSTQKIIFFVEDDEEIAYIIKFMLEREGYKIFHVNDGQKATDWIEKNLPPHLILLDLMLPYRDGIQILTDLRKKSEWKEVPVIILSAKSQESDIVRGLKSGANDYLTKPFQPMELLTRIKRYL